MTDRMTPAFAAPGESYWWWSPDLGEPLPVTEEAAHKLGRLNVDCDPERPLLVRAAGPEEAQDIALDWNDAKTRLAPFWQAAVRRGELPGAEGSFYFVLRD